MATLNDGTSLTGSYELTQRTGTKFTFATDKKYVTKDIEFTVNVKDGSASIPTASSANIITSNPTITYGTNKITVSHSANKNITPAVSPGWVSAGTQGTISTSGSTDYSSLSFPSTTTSFSIINAGTISITNNNSGSITVSNNGATIYQSTGTTTSGTVPSLSVAAYPPGTGTTRESAKTIVKNGRWQCLNSSGTAASVTAGGTYYGEVSVPTGNITINTPSINTSTGIITASATLGTAGYISAAPSSKTLNLTTQAADTYIPTTSDYTIPAGTYLTGDQTIKGDANFVKENIKFGVTIFGITGEYGGSTVTETQDAHGGTIANINTNGMLIQATKTVTPTYADLVVTPDAGYNALSEVIVQGIPGGNVQLQTKTITPTSTTQIITADAGYQGFSQITINRAPVGSWMGVDAELVMNCTSRNIALKDLPTFADWDRSTTTSKVLRASPSTGCDTFVADFSQYEYVIIQQMEVDFVYTGAPETAIKGKALREVYQNIQFLAQRPGTGVAIVEASNFNTAVCYAYMSGLHHYTTNAAGTTMAYYYAPGYGIYLSNQASTFSSATASNPTVTIREPVINGRCSSSYLATAHAQLLDTTNTKVKLTGKVYRVNKNSNWKRGEYESLFNLYHNGGGT